MAFVLSGSTITQSGTDTNPSSIGAIAGVTTITDGSGQCVTYDIGALTLVVNGTLTIPDRYYIKSNSTTSGRSLTVGTTGKFIIDGRKSIVRNGSAITVNSMNCGFIIRRPSGTPYVNMTVQFDSGSQFEQFGGIFETSGTVAWSDSTSSIITIVKGTWYIFDRNAYMYMNVYIRTGNLMVNGWTINSDGSALIGFLKPIAAGYSIVGYNPVGCGEPLSAIDSSTARVKLSGYVWGQNVADFKVRNGGSASGLSASVGGYDFIDAAGGDGMIGLGHGTLSQSYGWSGHTLTYSPKFLNATTNAPVTNAVLYLKDANSNNRKSINGLISDKLYISVTDSAGALLVNILTKIWTADGTNAIMSIDNRLPASGYMWAYGYVPLSVSVLSSVSPKNPTLYMPVDDNVTLSEASAVSKLSSNFIVSTVLNSISVILPSILDDLYDCMKAYKTRNIQSNLEYLGIANQLVNANGIVLDTGNLRLSGIEKYTAGSKFKTLKSTGNIVADGAFFINIIGNVEQATPTNINGVVITGNLIYNTNTDIAVTLTNCTISGTVSNSGTGNVKLNLVNSTVNTGARVTAQYPITVTDANGSNFSTQIWVFNSLGNIVEDTGFNSLVVNKTIYMPVGGGIRVYSQAYGTQSKITNTNATNASLVITHIPETLVDTSLPTATRNTVAGYFSSVVENSLLYVEVDTDLGSYTPAEVLNAMHYFIVSNGGNFAALSLLANTVGSVKLIDGGFRVYSAFFKGRAKSNLNATNTPSLYITLPLYIEDASGVSGNQVMVRNANGIDVHAALWSKATANISQNDMNSIADTTWSHNKRTLNDAIFE